jgi:hypothetical protein
MRLELDLVLWHVIKVPNQNSPRRSLPQYGLSIGRGSVELAERWCGLTKPILPSTPKKIKYPTKEKIKQKKLIK